MRSVRAREADKEGGSDPAWFPVTSPSQTFGLTISWRHLSASSAILRAAEQGFSGAREGSDGGDQPHIPDPREWQWSGDK